MNSTHRLGAAVAVCLGLLSGPASAVDVDAFVKRDGFEILKISPDGVHFAATIPMGDRTVLAVMKRADNTVTGGFNAGKNIHVADFDWVNPNRVLISTARKIGLMDQPRLTGDIYAIDADGGDAESLVGQAVNVNTTGTRIRGKRTERVAAFVVDDLPNDDRRVVIGVTAFTDDAYTRAELMDVESGARTVITRSPVRNANFTTDNAGQVRFAQGEGVDIVNKLYHRTVDGDRWVLVNDEAVSGIVESPIGFSADNATAYLEVEHKQGPNSIVALDIATQSRREVLRDDDTDPGLIIYQPGTSIPVGAVILDGKPRTAFFDAASAEAKVYRSLEAAFKGEFAYITSSTADGRMALVQVVSDRNPGDFYLFDRQAKKAEHLVSRRAWFDPATMSEAQPVTIPARDGLPLHGFLSMPKGVARNAPLVVMPHGGPFTVFDTWDFDDQTQLLTSAGYAVLRVNFRGSGNHGRAFTEAGARQWGGTMQDDVTDATRWAIAQGHADAKRVCIYGASYGAYAALMGVAKEPAMYRCAVGYVGVYDLPLMHKDGDIQQRGSGETFLREWIGEPSALAAVSPNRLADRIKVPVFLAAGGEDERAPIAHSKMMELALGKAGVPVETLYYPTEGHGFYVDANRKEYYTRLLAFLARNIGGATATAGVAKAD